MVIPESGYNGSVTSAGQYIAVEGDTLSSIAAAHGMTLDDLLAKNPQITNHDLIYVGQTIIL